MGYALSWLAVRGRSRDQVLDMLSLEPTGEREDFPESDLVGAELPGGWYIVSTGEFQHSLLNDGNLRRLSSGCEVVSAGVEEHVMCSIASGWKNERLIWRVTHDPEKDIRHLDVEGNPPEPFVSIRDGLLSQQREADEQGEPVDCIFDIPIKLAETITGYRHDTDIADAELPFEVLRLRPGSWRLSKLWA